MIKSLLIVIALAVPGLLIYLNINYPEVSGRLFFSIFIVLVAVIKIWESFYTSKEKNATRYHGDWTLILTSLLYFFTGSSII